MSENTPFKVVDKRRFTEEGDAKPESEKQEAAKPKEETPKVEPEKKTTPEITFPIFMQSLAHQVFMALGLVPWPDSGLIKKDIEQAKQTIDILSMLRKKVEGNLEKDEEKMIDGLLYELRLTFVKVKEGSIVAPAQPEPPKEENSGIVI